MSSKQLAEFGTRHISRGISRLSDLVFDKAKGSWVWTVEGKKCLDFSTGIGVVSTGHCHPKVVKAVQEQAAKLNHAQVNISFQKPMLDLVKKLIPIMPSSDLDTFFFWNSGSEAVEASIKLARQATRKPNIIVFEGSFHGRTFGTMPLTTSKTVYRVGFGPFMPGVHVTPYPYCFRCPVRRAAPDKYDFNNCCNNPIDQIELLLKQQTSPEDTAAILIETELGEGGYVPSPKSFFPKLREICDKNDILLIVDEVQCGFGRTGKMFAVEHYGITPDIMVMAKGIASGYPLSAIVSKKEFMDKLVPGSMGGSYSGNAVACAAAIATLEIFEEEKLLNNVNARSAQMFSLLNKKLKPILPSNVNVDIRGLGLMIGLEFTGVPRGFAASVAKESFEQQDMILLTASIFETLRLIPPLNVTEEEVDDGVERLCKALGAVIERTVKEGKV